MKDKKFDYLALKRAATKIKNEVSILDYFFSLEKAGVLKFEGKIGKEHFFGFMDQRTGSISIGESTNLWFDHSSGQGGDIIKAVQVFENLSFFDAVEKLKANTPIESNIIRKKQVSENNYEILKEIPISHPALKQYIISRGLDPDEVSSFCKELHWRHNENVYFGIGLKNDHGGWSVRSKLFKGNLISSGISTVKLGDRIGAIKVFEGMFDFLSYVKLFPIGNFLAKILNSTANFSTELMEEISLESEIHQCPVELYLDNDEAGNQKTITSLKVITAAVDKRELYQGFGDMNEMMNREQNRRRKR